MENDISSPQTPRFGIPKNNINFSEILKMELDFIEKTKKEKKPKKEKSKNKKRKHYSEKLFPSTLSLDKENPYYELLTKKIKLKNDFDRKHVKKFLAEIEEGFEGCELDDEINEDNPSPNI